MNIKESTKAYRWLYNILPPRESTDAGSPYAPQYGAWDIAQMYCGKRGALRPRGQWLHGWHPASHSFDPQLVIGGSGLSRRWRKYLVWRADQAAYLRSRRFFNVIAIGSPYLYLRDPEIARIPDSILLMPPHSAINKESLPRAKAEASRYIREIEPYLDSFSCVMACITPQCYEKRIYVDEFLDRKIPLVVGASIGDRNAMARMARIFSAFSVVTTPVFGSHIVYAGFFGAKVSMYGHKGWSAYSNNYLAKTTFFQNSYHLLSKSELILNPPETDALRCDPLAAQKCKSWASEEMGINKKKTPRQLLHAIESWIAL